MQFIFHKSMIDNNLIALALQNGVDPKTVSGMLGHYSAEFTPDVYANVTKEMKKEAAEKIGNYMEQVI